MPDDDPLLHSLPAASRLALAYAPASARLPTLGLLALDARLAGLLRHSREPMLAQLRLSWWRESLGQDAGDWPAGEPLLAALRSWNGHHQALSALVDGWEALTGPAPLPEDALLQMAQGRAAAFAGLARALGHGDQAEAAHRLGLQWGLCDLALYLGDAREREAAASLARLHDVRKVRVRRPLRPLLVLHGLARSRLVADDPASEVTPRAMMRAMRLGLLGF